MTNAWAVLPIKTFAEAKQRLASVLPPPIRRALARAMAEDVLAALAESRALAGIVAVTADGEGAALARRYGAEVLGDDAADGQTRAVAAALATLLARPCGGALTMPIDVPLVTAGEIDAVITAAQPAPSFTIVPAHDRRGSNCILLRPPDAVPLAFGNDSYLPHLAAARARGLEPTIMPLPGIGLDIDTPDDLVAFLAVQRETRARWVLRAAGLDNPLIEMSLK